MAFKETVTIPLHDMRLVGNEMKYVEECIRTGLISSGGTFVSRFERSFSEIIGAKFAVATSSGTSALHLALLVAGVMEGELVLVPAFSYIASANAVRYVGALPVFIDIEPRFYQMDAGKLADFISKQCRWSKGTLVHKPSRRRVKALLPVHLLGHPVDMKPLMALAEKFELKVIEDCAQSLGAKYRNKNVGTFGDIGCFSFNGNKALTMGGGGMLVTDDERLTRKALYLSTQAKDDRVESVHKEVGYNYRLSGLHAAIGLAQLEQKQSIIANLRQWAASYAADLSKVEGIRFAEEAFWAYCTFSIPTILVDERSYGMDRSQLRYWLRQKGIETRPLWQPLSRSIAHDVAISYQVEVADSVYQKALTLPCRAHFDGSIARLVGNLITKGRNEKVRPSATSSKTIG